MTAFRSIPVLRACAIALGLAAAGVVHAQADFPNRPVTLIVSAAPGGTTDIAARLIAQPLGAALGQSVVVENKPGASGGIAAQAVARAKPDGYTLLLQYSGFQVITPHVTPTGGWDLAMSPFSKQKEAAAIFMKWMTVDDGGNYSRYRPAPELPANNEGLKMYLEKPLFQTEEGKKAASLITFESDKTGFPRVQTVGYLEFESIIGQAFSDIANGADAKKALTDATGSLKTAWAKYNKG